MGIIKTTKGINANTEEQGSCCSDCVPESACCETETICCDSRTTSCEAGSKCCNELNR